MKFWKKVVVTGFFCGLYGSLLWAIHTDSDMAFETFMALVLVGFFVFAVVVIWDVA